MSAIKKFFEKKKIDLKFKQAGHGHKLNESPASSSGNVKSADSGNAIRRRQPSLGSAHAADAAVARLELKTKQANKKPMASSSSTWKNQTSANAVDMRSLKKEVIQEIGQETKQVKPRCSPLNNINLEEEQIMESSPKLTCVSFSCPICPVSLPENEINSHIEECLQREIETEPGMISASMIHTLNDTQQVKLCIETLNKYLQNIIKNPSEEKYRKIKQSNKVFKEKVASLKGAKELLVLAIGFVDVKLPNSSDDNQEEDFYVLSEGLALDTDRLTIIKEYLNEAEPLKASLDRNVKVFEPATGSTNMSMPDEFYDVSNYELKREQTTRTESLEKGKQLMTKAMRDAAKISAKRSYRFTLIRIRFQDGIILEGTFYSKDNFSEVQTLVKESVALDWLPFELRDASGHILKQPEASLESLNLAPAAILNFQWDQSLAADIEMASGHNNRQLLTDELMARKISL